MGRNNADLHGVRYEFTPSNLYPSVYAYLPNDKLPVGMLNWHHETGAIGVVVDEEHQRKGIATGMYNHALKVAAEKGITPPNLIKSSYGNKGFKWARSLGLPKNFGKK